MNLAVIFTGGTIGSRTGTDGWIAPNKEQPYAILEQYRKEHENKAKEIEFDCVMPYQILSENLDAEHLMLLIDTIQEKVQKNRYDGIIVCHGTDTLQYTAAILDYVFADITIPLFLVSSNYPLEDTRANGLANFYYAVESVSKNLQGVFAVYQNSDGKTYIHRGSRMLAHQTFEDDLFSIHHRFVGCYDEHGTWVDGEGLAEKPEKIPYHGLTFVTDSILWLRAYPGMAYPELSSAVKAIVLESYHSGTIAINSELERLAEMAKRQETPIYLVGAVCSSSGYETKQNYARLGIHVLENQTPIGVYCRLWLEMSAWETESQE